MKTITTKIALAVLIAAAFTLNSCKKEETPVKTATTYPTNEATLLKVAQKQAAWNNDAARLTLFVTNTLRKNNIHFKKEDDEYPSLSVTIDSASTPHTATLDFGSGCTGNVDSIFMAGKIVIEYMSDDLGVVGTSFKATYTNYVMDSTTFNGSITVANNGDPYLHIDINLTTDYKKDELELTGTSSFQMTYSENDLANDNDNTLSFSGFGNGTTNAGVDFIQTINTPLVTTLAAGCDHFVSGNVTITSPSSPDRVIDYGSGICDNYATLSIGGGSPSTIRLH